MRDRWDISTHTLEGTMLNLLEDFYDGLERRAEAEARREDKWFLFGVVWFSAWFLVFLGLCLLG